MSDFSFPSPPWKGECRSCGRYIEIWSEVGSTLTPGTIKGCDVSSCPHRPPEGQAEAVELPRPKPKRPLAKRRRK